MTLGVVAGAMAKIADDVVLLAQTEVGEVSEGTAPGKGGSSAMPQKHNPVDATAALASARLAVGGVPVILSAMAQEHERAIGGWQAEWAAIPDLFRFTAGAVERVRGAVAGLQVDTARMKANLDLTGGLIMAESLTMALAPHIGRPEAQRKLVFSYLGNPGVGPLHCLRRAIEKGIPVPLEIEEYSHYGMVGRYFAGASHLPFFPLRSYLGSDMPRVNERIKMVDNPYGDGVVAVVPPLHPDVAIIHAQHADRQGNTHLWGLLGVQKEVAFAAHKVIVVVEEIVDESVIRADPNRTLIPGLIVDAVVHVPYGRMRERLQSMRGKERSHERFPKLSERHAALVSTSRA